MAKEYKPGQFPASVRYNWGYWDGKADRDNGRARRVLRGKTRPLPSWDAAYRKGYEAGYDREKHRYAK